VTNAYRQTDRTDHATVRVSAMPPNHRLNGSSSPVLTATPRSYGKGQNSTPYKIKVPERIGMKFGRVDYVLEIYPRTNLVTIGAAGDSG